MIVSLWSHFPDEWPQIHSEELQRYLLQKIRLFGSTPLQVVTQLRLGSSARWKLGEVKLTMCESRRVNKPYGKTCVLCSSRTEQRAPLTPWPLTQRWKLDPSHHQSRGQRSCVCVCFSYSLIPGRRALVRCVWKRQLISVQELETCDDKTHWLCFQDTEDINIELFLFHFVLGQAKNGHLY